MSSFRPPQPERSVPPVPPHTPSRRTAVDHHRSRVVRLAPHPDAPNPADLRAVAAWARANDPRPTAIDMFCGAGGLSLGLADAGFRVLVGADADPWSVETHAANLPSLGFCGDLTDPTELLQTLHVWGIDHVDLVTGGVPCQPFSRAGSSKIRSLVDAGERSRDDARARLWESFMTVVGRLRPRAVLIENVPDLPRWDDGAVLISFYEGLRDLGYAVDARVLDAFRHGVPQHRQRLFIVGLLDAPVLSWPEGKGELISLRDAIGDLPIIPRAQRAERLDHDADRVTSDFQRQMRAGLAEEDAEAVWDHCSRDVRPDDLEAFELLGEGQTYADLPPRLQRYRSDIFTDKYRRLGWSELCRTITAHIAKDGYWYIHPDQHRTLSIREAARIQTFPDRYRFAGQFTHRFKQIGNAVPPRLGAAVGRALLGTLRLGPQRAAQHPQQALRRELLEWHAGHQRHYPWRAGLAPWPVLLAEMCLHRTRADQVVPIFEQLLRLAPTPAAMLHHEQRALEIMRGLGLRWRAENIIEVARTLIADFEGEVPDDEMDLRSLPGVGDYVCRAVLCFGFNRRAVLLDTNTMRVSTRIHARDEARRYQLRLDLHRLAGAEGPDQAFNYALLDLGALICRAGTPRCDLCPIRRHCATGRVAEEKPQLELATSS